MSVQTHTLNFEFGTDFVESSLTTFKQKLSDTVHGKKVIGLLQSLILPRHASENHIQTFNDSVSKVFHSLSLPILGGDTSRGTYWTLTLIIYCEAIENSIVALEVDRSEKKLDLIDHKKQGLASFSGK